MADMQQIKKNLEDHIEQCLAEVSKAQEALSILNGVQIDSPSTSAPVAKKKPQRKRTKSTPYDDDFKASVVQTAREVGIGQAAKHHGVARATAKKWLADS